MKLRTILVGSISLPIPEEWQPTGQGASYAGVEGLMDPRISERKSSEDYGVRTEILGRGGEVAEILVQGHFCLRGRYLNGDARVRTYSIDVGDGTEVRAVYVFRPGHEPTESAIAAALESTMPGTTDPPARF
jgi:hypothetical protein